MTSAVAAIVVSLSPVITAGLSRHLLPSERLALAGVIGLILGLIGVVLLTRQTLESVHVSPGVVFVFFAAVSFALGSVLNRRIDDTPPIETLEAWAMLSGALLMHLIRIVLGESTNSIAFTPTAIGSLVCLSLVASSAGYLVYFDLLDRLGPVEINLVSYVAPVFAAAIGFLILNEIIDVYTVAGFLVLVAGFVLLKRADIREVLSGMCLSQRMGTNFTGQHK